MTLLLTLLLACGGAEQAPAPAPAPAVEKEAPVKEAPAKEEKEEPAKVASPEAVAAKVNLNTATNEEFLEVMPELGEKMLHEFEEYRPYKSIAQFRKEMSKYVPEEKVAEYEEHVFVPIAYNSCDVPTLRQIPGLDKAKAKELVAGRPWDTPDKFVADLGKVMGGVDATVYLPWLAE